MERGGDRSQTASNQPRQDLYQVLDELDRLEELLEDMDVLGVTTRAEAEARMRQLELLAEDLGNG